MNCSGDIYASPLCVDRVWIVCVADYGIQMNTCQRLFGLHMETFGERLRKERLRLGFNQVDFGAAGGVKKVAQINYEKDKRFPDASYLSAIAQVGADVGYIVAGVRGGDSPNLSKEAGEFLISTFQVSEKWLATGEGAIFQTDSERELRSRLDVLKEATRLANLEGLDKFEQARAMELVMGLMMNDVDMARRGLTELSQDEKVLIDCYRSVDQEGKNAIEATAKALAKK